MSIRFFINKTTIFYIDLGRNTPCAKGAYPISWGKIFLDEQGETEFATFHCLGKIKYPKQ